jgi:multicomponent Na+:H+ antiporter subunit B
MTPRTRRRFFIAACVVLAIVLVWGLAALPGAGAVEGRYANAIVERAVGARHATNVVAVVTFDIRGFDTLGEEFILFAAVMGAALLLREQRDERRVAPTDEASGRRSPHDSDAVRELGSALVGPAVLFGLYVVLHGHLTPGGGFQGGAVLASAPLLMYLVGEFVAFRRLSPERLIEVGEATGAGGFVVVGGIGIVAGTTFLANVLPLGSTGDVLSSGTILALNLCVGLAVSAGLVLLLSEFLEQTLEVRERSR